MAGNSPVTSVKTDSVAGIKSTSGVLISVFGLDFLALALSFDCCDFRFNSAKRSSRDGL